MAWKKTNSVKNLPTLQSGVTSLTDVFKLVHSRKETEEFYELEAAEVVDILLLEEDLPDINNAPDFSLIGAIKARLVNSEQNTSIDELAWILPLDTNIKQYPLKGEYVIISSYMGFLYYSQKLNMLASPNFNVVPGLSQLHDVPNGDFEMEEFQFDSKIRQLWPYEGDILFNGRFGQGIRFGSNIKDLTPNLKLSVGHADVSEQEWAKPVIENINDDASSIWMISNEVIDFTPAHDLAATPDEFSENQIFINTNRLILNSKTQETLIYSAKGVHIGTPEITTKIGSKTDEHLALGETTVELLGELIDAILGLTGIPTGAGPSGTVKAFPANLKALTDIKNKLDTLLTKE